MEKGGHHDEVEASYILQLIMIDNNAWNVLGSPVWWRRVDDDDE